MFDYNYRLKIISALLYFNISAAIGRLRSKVNGNAVFLNWHSVKQKSIPQQFSSQNGKISKS